ncbi:hypothetical protein J6590_060706 [Homalodisca vitripennis]|nr:hypothetical protein J6590_060706 [Homalodisca vitripennis]
MAPRTEWTIRLIMHMIDSFTVNRLGRIQAKPKWTWDTQTRPMGQFRGEYSHYRTQGESDDDVPNFRKTLPPSRNTPRVSHPPNVLQKKKKKNLQ